MSGGHAHGRRQTHVDQHRTGRAPHRPALRRDVAERTHCRLVSVSDAFGPGIGDRGQLGVLWEFSIEAIDATATRFTNRIQVSAVAGYDEALRQQGATLEQAQQRTEAALVPHNAEETPLFAQDIERKALEGRWQQYRVLHPGADHSLSRLVVIGADRHDLRPGECRGVVGQELVAILSVVLQRL